MYVWIYIHVICNPFCRIKHNWIYCISFYFYVIAAIVTTRTYCRLLGTPHGDVCTLIVGRFCLFILGNGFVGISDLSQTGTHTDITSWTHILAQCKSNTANSLETEVFICCDRESCIDECTKQEGLCLCNLSGLNLDTYYTWSMLFWQHTQTTRQTESQNSW